MSAVACRFCRVGTPHHTLPNLVVDIRCL